MVTSRDFSPAVMKMWLRSQKLCHQARCSFHALSMGGACGRGDLGVEFGKPFLLGGALRGQRVDADALDGLRFGGFQCRVARADKPLALDGGADGAVDQRRHLGVLGFVIPDDAVFLSGNDGVGTEPLRSASVRHDSSATFMRDRLGAAQLDLDDRAVGIHPEAQARLLAIRSRAGFKGPVAEFQFLAETGGIGKGIGRKRDADAADLDQAVGAIMRAVEAAAPGIGRAM